MVNRFTLFLGWLVVVAVATTLTWQIVSAADERVSDRPIAPLNVSAPVIAAATSTTSDSPTTTTQTNSPPTTLPGPGTTSASPPTTTVSPPPPPTTTTSAPAQWKTRTVQTTGGSVNLRYRPGEVAYQSATPAPGFHFEVEKEGPPEVKVEFESESQRVDIEASWNNDDLDIKVSEEVED